MTNKDEILRSERGGKSAIDGFKYERDIIAFLSIRMYCNTEKIARIICEYKNDIEIEMEDFGLCSWQVKKTDLPKLSKKEIFESIELFSQINETGNYSRFVLTCNKDLANTHLDRIDWRPFSYLRNRYPSFERMLQKLNYDSAFMSKLYFIKGPEPDSIRAVIKEEMNCISDKDNFLNQLNVLIDQIWAGITYIQDRKIIEDSKTNNATKEFKTINKDRLRNFEPIISSLPSSEILLVDEDVNTLERSILDLNESKVEELMEDFKDPEYRTDVLKELSDLSTNHYIYKHDGIIHILKSASISNDKNELQQFFSILINVLRISKACHPRDYEKIIHRIEDYIEHAFISTEDKFRYPYLTIRDILKNNFNNKLCKLNWERVKSFMYDSRIRDENVIPSCNDNMEYLRINCRYDKTWKQSIMSCDRDISIRNQIYRIIKYR